MVVMMKLALVSTIPVSEASYPLKLDGIQSPGGGHVKRSTLEWTGTHEWVILCVVHTPDKCSKCKKDAWPNLKLRCILEWFWSMDLTLIRPSLQSRVFWKYTQRFTDTHIVVVAASVDHILFPRVGPTPSFSSAFSIRRRTRDTTPAIYFVMASCGCKIFNL